jgi:hypothetical protein
MCCAFSAVIREQPLRDVTRCSYPLAVDGSCDECLLLQVFESSLAADDNIAQALLPAFNEIGSDQIGPSNRWVPLIAHTGTAALIAEGVSPVFTADRFADTMFHGAITL